jgi:hypothetical protein
MARILLEIDIDDGAALAEEGSMVHHIECLRGVKEVNPVDTGDLDFASEVRPMVEGVAERLHRMSNPRDICPLKEMAEQLGSAVGVDVRRFPQIPNTGDEMPWHREEEPIAVAEPVGDVAVFLDGSEAKEEIAGAIENIRGVSRVERV